MMKRISPCRQADKAVRAFRRLIAGKEDLPGEQVLFLFNSGDHACL